MTITHDPQYVALLVKLAMVLVQQPGSTARQVAMGLSEQGLSIDRSYVNSIFYSERSLFWHWRDGSSAPLWYFVSGSQIPTTSDYPTFTAAPEEPEPQSSQELPFALYAWQSEALEAWRNSGRQGVIEAVTGSGKTRIGLAAAWDKLQRGGKVQILVPSIELLHQWDELVRLWLPGHRLGLMGDKHEANLGQVDVLISVVNSARDRPPKNVNGALVIADEVHRYGTERNSDALVEWAFSERLGLSATYARTDDGNEEHLDPFFGETCFELNYDRAIADEVMAHFKVALVGVQFSRDEMWEYETVDSSVKNLMAKLINDAGVAPEPFGTFMAEVNALGVGGYGEFTGLARAYINAFSRRRQILGNTPAKRELLFSLVPAVDRAQRTLVFTEHKQSAEDAASVLLSRGIHAAAIHSGLKRESRKNLLTHFADGSLRVLCAPRVLDEGVDVPEADLGIILAASQTRRQMIQRMGRVLRRKADGRLARFVIAYVQDTSEDPAFGAHGTFLGDIIGVAHEVRDFKRVSDSRTVSAYLNDYDRLRPTPEPRMANAN